MEACLMVLDRLIYEELPNQSTYDEFSSVVNKLKKEIDRTEQQLPGILSTKVTHEAFERCIQSVQNEILCWMKNVYSWLPEQERRKLKQSSDDWTDGYKKVYNALEKLLQFIERTFSRYIDITYIISAARFMDAQDKVTENLQFIETRFGKSDVDKACKEIIMRPLYRLIATDAATHILTYRDLFYLEKLHTGLSDLFIKYSNDDIFERLHKCLICLNFNDLDYFEHATQLMKTELNLYVTAKGKLLGLNKLEAWNNQLPVKAGIAYRSYGNSQKEMVRDWIADEKNFVKEQAAVEEAPPLPADFAKLFGVKVFVDLSADEASCLFGMLYKTGMIKNKVVKARLMELAAHFIATNRQEELSAESLRKKMYNPGASVVNSVIEKLEKVIDSAA